MKPLCIDLYCGLGGWAEGFLSEGYEVVGFDIERHDYGTGGYPGQLVLQDVLTLDGCQFRDAAVIVASPPCQFFSYTAMPWSRAKALAAAVRADPVRLEKELALFKACFRIAAEAGVSLVVENVVGAQTWVGLAKWHFGSFYLWGDVPALMPFQSGQKNTGGSWFGQRDGEPLERNDPRDMRRDENGEYVNAEARGGWNYPGEALDGVKHPGMSWSGYGQPGYKPQAFNGIKMGGQWWNDSTNKLVRKCSSRSSARKAASAQIAKIPFPLAQWIARCYKPDEERILTA